MVSNTFSVMKAGGGTPVLDGATVRVHLRSAARFLDLDNDALVLNSTYGSGVPVPLRVDKSILTPEVYRALVGQSVGSTVVIPVVRASPAGPVTLFVELWIADIQDPGSSERVVLARVPIGLASAVREEILRALNDAKGQRNGLAISLAQHAESAFLEISRQVRAEHTAPAPHKLSIAAADDHQNIVVTYLLSELLYRHLKQLIERLGGA